MSSEGGLRRASVSGRTGVLFAGLPRGVLTAGERNALRRFAKTLSVQLAGGAPFTCLVTGDQRMQELNRSFLGHDYPTDVLSFPSVTGGGELGEIAISAARAAAQAARFGHSCFDEMRILLLHGLLHLCGFDHEHDNGEMGRAERRWRTVFELPVNLIARTRRGKRAVA